MLNLIVTMSAPVFILIGYLIARYKIELSLKRFDNRLSNSLNRVEMLEEVIRKASISEDNNVFPHCQECVSAVNDVVVTIKS